MEKKRSIEDMMKLYGTKWVYISSRRTFTQFILDADAAGFSFGGMSPLDMHYSDIISVHDDRSLVYVGFVGHMAFQCGQEEMGGKPFLRIDYDKYISGRDDWAYKA